MSTVITKVKRKRIAKKVPINTLIFNKLQQLYSNPRVVQAKYKEKMFNIEMRGAHLINIQ